MKRWSATARAFSKPSRTFPVKFLESKCNVLRSGAPEALYRAMFFCGIPYATRVAIGRLLSAGDVSVLLPAVATEVPPGRGLPSSAIRSRAAGLEVCAVPTEDDGAGPGSSARLLPGC